MITRCIFSIIIICLFAFEGNAKPLSPLEFGLKEARTDIERYEVLLRTHTQAAKLGKVVSYKGINQITIEIPKEGRTIPLSYKTDFARVTIIVRNKAKKIALFELRKERYGIKLSKAQLSTGTFKDVNDICRGRKLLIIEDQTKWVTQRTGYNSGAMRKDILYLKQGKIQNSVVAQYNDEESTPEFYWCQAGAKQIIVNNLTFERTNDSDFITNLFVFSNAENILVKNVKTITPSNTGLYGDCIMAFNNCANIRVEDVTIEGTYSLKDKYGYGIGMDNVWNISFLRLKAYGEWGVFGNNNVNYATLEECDINRFDIHCYGKDVYCKNTVFRDLYNQFSSLYGTLRFEGCHFVNFVPVLFESSYSAYTHFYLIIEDCIIDVDSKRPYLINAGNPAQLSAKPRGELSKAYWPEIKIKNLTLNINDKLKNWFLFYIKVGKESDINGIKSINIDGLKINSSDNKPNVRLSNQKVVFQNPINVSLSNSNVPEVVVN